MEDVIRLLELYRDARFPREPGDVFAQHLTSRYDSWFVEAGDFGLIYLTNIVPSGHAQLHVLFWDEKLPRERIALVQVVVSKAFDLFELRRIHCCVYINPEKRNSYFNKHPLVRFLREAGLTHEGCLRNTFLFDNEIYDTVILSILPEEAVCPQIPTPLV